MIPIVSELARKYVRILVRSSMRLDIQLNDNAFDIHEPDFHSYKCHGQFSVPVTLTYAHPHRLHLVTSAQLCECHFFFITNNELPSGLAV